MIIKSDDTAEWVGFESPREIMLLSIIVGTIVDIPNEIINAKIQAIGNKVDYDETDLVIEDIDAASAKELATDLIKKLTHGNQDRNPE